MKTVLFVSISIAIFASYMLPSNKSTFGKCFQFFSQHLNQNERKNENAQMLGVHLACLCFSAFLGWTITFIITKLFSL